MSEVGEPLGAIAWLDLRAAILMLEQIAGTDTVQRWLRAIDVPAEQRTALVTALVAALKEKYGATQETNCSVTSTGRFPGW